MKKIVSMIVTICIVIAMLTGCSKTPNVQTPEPATAIEQPANTELPVSTEQASAAENTVTAEPTAMPASKVQTAEKIGEKNLDAAEQPKPVAVEEAKPAPSEPTKSEPYAEVKPEAITFTDSLGKTIIISKKPQRVVCLYTSYLDLWDLAGGVVVGRPDTKEEIPASAKDAETIGSYTSPNLEKILTLQPDLVLINSEVSAQVALIEVFEKNNISYIALKYNTFKDYLNMLKIYTEVTDREDLYQAKGVEVAKRVDSIIAKVPRDKKPSILLLLGSTKTVSVRLPNTTVGEMLQDLGTVNIAYDPNMPAADMEVFSMERVIEKNPDFIFAQTMGDINETTARIKKDIEANPAWGYLTAVKEGRYIFLPKDLFLFKPNERYAEAYETLAKMLYPDQFR